MSVNIGDIDFATLHKHYSIRGTDKIYPIAEAMRDKMFEVKPLKQDVISFSKNGMSIHRLMIPGMLYEKGVEVELDTVNKCLELTVICINQHKYEHEESEAVYKVPVEDVRADTLIRTFYERGVLEIKYMSTRSEKGKHKLRTKDETVPF